MRATYRFALLLLLLLASSSASATSYVPVTDEALVDHAPVIAVVKVRDSGSNAEGHRPATVYRMQVERAIKGAVTAGEVIQVRVPGGVGQDGRRLWIWGAPRFEPEKRALLFLAPRRDGSYDIVHLMLGAFHEVAGAGHRLALRNLSEARAAGGPGEAVPKEPVRDFGRFVDWVARRVRGIQATVDYEVAATPGIKKITDEYTLFQGLDGLYMRWFEFNQQQSVEWLAHQDGQQGVAGGGFAEFQTALADWNNETATNINYTYGGTTTSTNGLVTYDYINVILFNDPNEEITDFICGSGGILAYGGPWYENNGLPYRGSFYHPIVNADIVTNDGLACYFQGSPNPSKLAEELFAHELGHTLGIDHTNILGALMYPFISDDGLGGFLHVDDRAAAAHLYTPFPVSTDFFTLTPCRLLDTRNPNGPLGGPALAAGLPRTFSAAGQCGIPATAVSISVNVTVASPTVDGFLTLFPADRIQPSTSTLNFAPGQVRGNNAVLLLSADPQQAFTVLAGMAGLGTVHLIVDVNGWFE